MSQMDALLGIIGEAQFMTTIDLTKGYWQISLVPEDKEKGGFANPLGALLVQQYALWLTASSF